MYNNIYIYNKKNIYMICIYIYIYLYIIYPDTYKDICTCTSPTSWKVGAPIFWPSHRLLVPLAGTRTTSGRRRNMGNHVKPYKILQEIMVFCAKTKFFSVNCPINQSPN